MRNLSHTYRHLFLPSSPLVLLSEWKDLLVVLLGQLPQTGRVYVAGQGVPSSCAAVVFPALGPGCEDCASPYPQPLGWSRTLIEAMCGVLA